MLSVPPSHSSLCKRNANGTRADEGSYAFKDVLLLIRASRSDESSIHALSSLGLHIREDVRIDVERHAHR